MFLNYCIDLIIIKICYLNINCMINSAKQKIIIFDDSVAHGTYIGRHFNMDVFYFSSKYKILETLIQDKQAAYIFIVNDFKNIKYLQTHLNKSFKKILICSENFPKKSIPVDIPFDFVALNVLKDKWMKEVVDWLFMKKAIEASDFKKINNNLHEKYSKNVLTENKSFSAA